MVIIYVVDYIMHTINYKLSLRWSRVHPRGMPCFCAAVFSSIIWATFTSGLICLCVWERDLSVRLKCLLFVVCRGHFFNLDFSIRNFLDPQMWYEIFSNNKMVFICLIFLVVDIIFQSQSTRVIKWLGKLLWLCWLLKVK